jgi:hypothetical protein
MIRKGIEFDADREFEVAADAKHFTNTAGLIDVIKQADQKFVLTIIRIAAYDMRGGMAVPVNLIAQSARSSIT